MTVENVRELVLANADAVVDHFEVEAVIVVGTAKGDCNALVLVGVVDCVVNKVDYDLLNALFVAENVGALGVGKGEVEVLELLGVELLELFEAGR